MSQPAIRPQQIRMGDSTAKLKLSGDAGSGIAYGYSTTLTTSSGLPCPIMHRTQGYPGHAPSGYSLPNSFFKSLDIDLEKLPTDPNSRPLQDLMMRFQSLGDNCEFGLLQRRAGAEPLDLLRFAGFYVAAEDLLSQTVRALEEGFAGIGNPASVICELHGDRSPREYMIRDVFWNLMYHSGLHEDEIESEELRLRQVQALGFRRRIFLADLKAADRVFVWKSTVGAAEADVRRLAVRLRQYGPNLLLWVNIEDAYHLSGCVEYAGSGLLKGYVRRFAPFDAAGDSDFDSWYDMCQNAAAAADRLRTLGHWSHRT
jgi:hypothetical protein